MTEKLQGGNSSWQRKVCTSSKERFTPLCETLGFESIEVMFPNKNNAASEDSDKFL